MRALDERVDADAADLVAKFRRTTLRCLQDLEGKQHVEETRYSSGTVRPGPGSGGDDARPSRTSRWSDSSARSFSARRWMTREGMRRPRKGKSRHAGRGRGAGRAAGRGDSGRAPKPAPPTRMRNKPSRSLPFPSVGISPSGGVDSMVLAAVLRRLSDEYGGFAVVAMHIDYGNGRRAAPRRISCGLVRAPRHRVRGSSRGGGETRRHPARGVRG